MLEYAPQAKLATLLIQKLSDTGGELPTTKWHDEVEVWSIQWTLSTVSICMYIIIYTYLEFTSTLL